ncbi:MAG: hypothetical protein RSE32_14535 [Comamonas sp.]|uniref:hypothetical protein n=1 Tax=Comamonas sp. TaxID=34028 RepID=UPI002FC97B02
MTIINNGQAVVTGPVTVLWDGISRPEDVQGQNGKPDSKKFTIKFAADPSEPAVGELRGMLDAEAGRVFPSGKPRNFQATFGALTAGEYDGKLTGQLVCTATTYGNPPAIYDAQGREVPAASCGLYSGAKVRLILTPRIYNAMGNVGESAWLSGVQIVDLTTEKLAGGAGMSAGQVASAFGIQGGAAAFAAPVPSLPSAPLAPNPGIVPPVPTDKLKALGHTVEALQAAGWTIEQMREQGYVI